MKIPFPAFIKRIFEKPSDDRKKMFDFRNAQPSQVSSSSARQFVTQPSLEIKSYGNHNVSGKHISTPIPQTPVFLRNTRQSACSEDLASVKLRQEFRGKIPIALTTPMVMSSLGSLESSVTPADAFPDILDIIDQAWPADSYESSSLLNSGSEVDTTCDSVCTIKNSKNEQDLLEMLISVAEQIESERSVSSRSYVYTQPVDMQHSRTYSQRKYHHAKLMTSDEKKYYRNVRAKERKKELCCPARGVRRSTRVKKSV